MSREAMKQALEAFDALYMNDYSGYEISKHESYIIDDAVKALRQALETDLARVGEVGVWGEWQGLTDEEIVDATNAVHGFGAIKQKDMNFAKAIEAKLREKNHG